MKKTIVISFLFWGSVFSEILNIGCIISVHNRPEYLKQTLDHLKNTRIDNSLFLYLAIIDDCSSDYKSIDLVRDFQIDAKNVEVHKIFLKKNQGIANVLNLGFRVLKRKSNISFFCNIDSDIISNPLWLQKLFSLAQKVQINSQNKYNFFTAYNSRLHEIKSDHVNYLEKKTIGGANIFFHKNCLNLVLSSLKKGRGWDWELVRLIEINQGAIYCTKPSYLQHIGMNGMNMKDGVVVGSKDLVDVADDFIFEE